MLRLILSVLAGYVTMFAAVFVTFTASYRGLGADRAFRPGTYEVTPVWMVLSVVLGFSAALLGGLVASTIGRSAKAAKALAGLVVVLGLLFAIPVLTAPAAAPAVRDASVGNMAAMQNAKEPKWMALLNPFLGAAGALAGARLRKAP